MNQSSFGLNRLSPRGNLTGISTIESKTRSLFNAKNNRHNESIFSSEDIGDTIQQMTGLKKDSKKEDTDKVR